MLDIIVCFIGVIAAVVVGLMMAIAFKDGQPPPSDAHA